MVASFENLQFSSDGKFVYCIRDRNAPGLRSVPVDGGEETTVLESVLLSTWTISATGIYFVDVLATSRAFTRPLKFFSFQTHGVTEIAKLDYPLPIGGPGLSVSPDGRWVLFARLNGRNSDLFLLENIR